MTEYKEYKAPVEVLLKVRESNLDTTELHLMLQDIADDWFMSKMQTIPCSYIDYRI